MRTSPARVSERGHRSIRTPLALNSGSAMPSTPSDCLSLPVCRAVGADARDPAQVFPKAFLWSVKVNVCPGRSGIVGSGKPGSDPAGQRGENR
ncbi:hypothetical protein GCM10010282_57390 [Streptomyces roseolus]|nr:hypothetical protein GCM10010282_57390 [Streptomyces roseolus]